METTNIHILGGGPAGLTTGYYAKKYGFPNFTIFEAGEHAWWKLPHTQNQGSKLSVSHVAEWRFSIRHWCAPLSRQGPPSH